MILEIVKDRKEKQFVLEFVLVEKIVLRWGGETEQYLLLKSLKQFAKNIFYSFMSVSLYFFPFSTYLTDLHNGCTYTERSVFSFTSLPPLCKVSSFKSGSPCQDFKSCMYFLLQNNSYKYKLESNN